MAILPEDDKQVGSQDNQNQNNNQNASNTGGGTSAGSAGGGFISSPAANSGMGAGGQGWTNIQSYLFANKDDKSSANNLANTVGSQFDKESKDLSDSSNAAKQSAQDFNTQNNMSQDQASKLVQQAGQSYKQANPYTQSYGTGGISTGPGRMEHPDDNAPPPPTSDDYNNSTGALKNFFNTQYAGPTQYNYGLNDKTQQYGTNLGSDTGFKALMGDLNQQAAQKAGMTALGSGGMALQEQLDQDNPYVNQARQNAISQYAGLTGNYNQALTDTNQALADAKTQFGNNQTAVRGQITDLANNDDQKIRDAMDQWNTQENAIRLGNDNPANLHGTQSKSYTYDPKLYTGDPNDQLAPDGSGKIHTVSANADQFYKYNPGDVATEGNIDNVAGQRDEFNAIQDVLGLGNYITPDSKLASHGQNVFNQDAYNNALAWNPTAIPKMTFGGGGD